MKLCRKCGSVKERSEFSQCSSKKDGLQSNCKDCKSAINRTYDRNNRSVLWAKRNPEKAKAIYRKWYEKNKTDELLRSSLWKKNNRDRCAALGDERAKRIRGQRPIWANRRFIADMYMIARLVSEATGIKHHVDHIVPLKAKDACGLHVEENLRVIPATMNLMKKNNMADPAAGVRG